MERLTVAVELAPSLRLRNPVMAGPSAFGYGTEHGKAVDLDRIGAVVTRPITLAPRPPALGPRLVETAAGVLWADGWANVGLSACLRDIAPAWRRWDTPVVAAVAGESVEEHATVAEALAGAAGVAAIQLDLTLLTRGEAAQTSGRREVERLAVEAVAAARAGCDLPLLVDLSAWDDPVAAAEPVVAAGADCLCVVNALPGIVVDVRSRRPRLGAAVGGLSGPAVRPAAVRMVYELARSLPGVTLIGAGGITSAEDALQYIMAGARAVQIGTGSLVDPRAPAAVVADLEDFLRREGLTDVTELVGAAL